VGGSVVIAMLDIDGVLLNLFRDEQELLIFCEVNPCLMLLIAETTSYVEVESLEDLKEVMDTWEENT
jgi:hypothetical protein